LFNGGEVTGLKLAPHLLILRADFPIVGRRVMMSIRKASCAAALLAALLSSHSATAETTLRIAMTASDIPTATGCPTTALRACVSSATRSSKDWCCGI
jgi:hypothetical protein